MQPAERNYKIYNKELLAVVETLTKWKQYLLDTLEISKIWTDHENLKYFQEPHKLNRRQVRWYLKLQDYNFTLQHIPGKINTKADILSRKDQVNMKEDNKNIQLLKEELWSRRITAEITIIERKTTAEECDVIKEIWKNSTREKEVVQALEKQDGLTWEEDRVVYMEERIYVPNNKRIREEILEENYDSVDVSYPGQHRMLELLKRMYWWPGLEKDVKKYVQGCFKYQ